MLQARVLEEPGEAELGERQFDNFDKVSCSRARRS